VGRRLALIIGNSIFRDPSLARLLTPDADVGALADVLLSPEIGAFDDVKLVVNMASASIRRSISEFFSNKTRDDLLLLYFSGHGVLDENGRLYLATKETERNYLRGTAIPAAFITDEMDHSRSRRQVLVLDCCHSGAFARGSKGAPGASVGTATAFEGKGYGRVVLTASDATQYAWEGDQVIGEADNSVFTHFLVQGLQTGKADADADGQITVDELYDYVYEQVISQTPKQTPGKWSYREQGEIILAHALAGAPPRPEEIQLPEFDDEIETRLKHMYDTGLAAYWLDDWDRAARAFQAILDARSDYPGALEKLREARRNAELARLYQTAQDARQSRNWDAAISALEALLAQAPDYRDAASQLQTARQQAHLAELYAEARQLCRAGKWYAARRVLARIAETGPDYPDEDGLQALVEENIAALERQKKLEDLYSQALARIDSGALDDARVLLSQIEELEPGYAETGRLVAKVVTLIQRQAEERQRQEQIDALYSQAIALASAEQWPEVLSKLAAIRRLSPQFEDPQDLLATAERRIELAEQESQRQEELAALYVHAVQLLNAGNYQKALEKWAELHAQDSGYPDREKVQFRAKEKLDALSRGSQSGAWKSRLKGVARKRWALLALITLIALSALFAPSIIENFFVFALPEQPCEPYPNEQDTIASHWLSQEVKLDGKLTRNREWIDAACYSIEMRLWPEGDRSIPARWWFKNDDQYLYILGRVPASELNAFSAFINYFWPYPFRDSWENSDGAWIDQEQEIWDSYGWDENKWYGDVDDGGQENVAGAASQDEQFFWFEFSKALDSGDPHDWSWQPGNVVGTNRTGDLMLGIGSPDFPAHFFHLIRLELHTP
jgi:outer membrane protein assembly factor BamD (BamD/ComL family)